MKGVNDKLIDLLIESKILDSYIFRVVFYLLSIIIFGYSFLVIYGSIINLSFINYDKVKVIYPIVILFIGILTILWVLNFARNGKNTIDNDNIQLDKNKETKEILKEKIMATMKLLKNNTNNKLGNFSLVNSTNFTNYKTFVQRTYKNTRVEIGISLNGNNLYFNFWKNEKMKENFHKYLDKKNIKNELFENDIYGLYLIEDENLDINLSSEDLNKKIEYYIELVNKFIKK